MQAVLRLIKDLRGMLLQNLRCDLFSAVCWQAMLYHCIRLCNGHDLIIDLEALECLAALLRLFLLPHGGPNVRNHHIGARAASFGSFVMLNAGCCTAKSKTIGFGL